MAEALHANCTASVKSRLSDKATVNAPLNTSPAAVVSIASTFIAGIILTVESQQTKAPLEPKVIITFCTPIPLITCAALHAETSSVIFTPDTGYEIDNVTVNGVKATVTGNQLKVTMTENKTVVVTYKKTETQNPTTYTISFDMNGHGTQVDAQTVNEGAKATKPADPTAEGYNFKGWYADENLTNEFDFETAIKADTTVYANWKKKADKPAEPVDPGTDPGTQDPGTEPVTPENPTEPVEPGTTPTVEKFMITVDPNGGTWNDSTAAKIYEIEKGQYLTLPAAPTKEGYTFMYWKGSKYQPGDKYLVEGEHTFTAVWQKNGVSDKTSPKTGDNAMLYVYTLGLLAATSAVLILNSRRNKKEQ